MAPANKLLVEIDGVAMVRRAVEAACAAQVVATTVVLGNDAAKLTTDQQAMTALLLRSPLAQTPVPEFATPPIPR